MDTFLKRWVLKLYTEIYVEYTYWSDKSNSLRPDTFPDASAGWVGFRWSTHIYIYRLFYLMGLMPLVSRCRCRADVYWRNDNDFSLSGKTRTTQMCVQHFHRFARNHMHIMYYLTYYTVACTQLICAHIRHSVVRDSAVRATRSTYARATALWRSSRCYNSAHTFVYSAA